MFTTILAENLHWVTGADYMTLKQAPTFHELKDINVFTTHSKNEHTPHLRHRFIGNNNGVGLYVHEASFRTIDDTFTHWVRLLNYRSLISRLCKLPVVMQKYLSFFLNHTPIWQVPPQSNISMIFNNGYFDDCEN